MIKKYLEKRRERKKKRKEERKNIGVFREYFELISEVLIYVFFVMTFLLQSFVIPTGSMENTLLIGDHLLVDKVAYSRSIGTLDSFIFPQKKIGRGMIVTFKAPPEMEKEYVKRVIGLPGETIKIINTKVFINGKLLNEPYTFYKGERRDISKDNFPQEKPPYLIFSDLSFYAKFQGCLVDTDKGKAFLIPEGSYFCMGDNRDNSYDSRFWGSVPSNYIIGKPWRIYWSYTSSTKEYLTPGVWHKVKDIFKTILNFFSKTRWNRTIKKIE